MSESDERRDDERDETSSGEGAAWNEPAPVDEDELPIAVRRVLASDQHLSERRVFFGHAGADEPESEAETKDGAEDGAPQ